MATSRIETIPDIGEVKVTKKKGLSRISLKLHHSGQIRVSQPYYLPFAAGFKFAIGHTEWITKQQAKERPLKLYNEMKIGKGYTYKIIQGDTLRSRVGNDKITITKPEVIDQNDKTVLDESKKAIKRALNTEAKELLPGRVAQLAKQYGYNYNQVKTRPMKTRWGSCSSKKVITLSCYLLMLPWPLIDYVILHELSHTKQMNHSYKFWEEVASSCPNYKELKKELKILQPDIYALYI